MSGHKETVRRLVATGTIRSGHRRILVTPEPVELPPLPRDPAARRRTIAVRGL